MNPLRWLLLNGAAALTYTVVFIFDLFEDGFNIPPIVHGYIRAALAIGLTIATVAWLIERSAIRSRQYFDRRMNALTNAAIEAGLRQPDREDTAAIVSRIARSGLSDNVKAFELGRAVRHHNGRAPDPGA